MADERTAPPSVPQARAVPRRHTRFSFVWIVPILAAVVGGWVAMTRILSEGPKIIIVFPSAEGLEAGKTKIRYKGVDVGTISNMRLSEDHQRIVATAQMAPRTDDFLVQDTQFWVVKPRISGANVTGLGTLISGSFVGMEIGSSSESKREFVALDTPPIIAGGAPGRFFVLKTSNLGSIDRGTPIFFRHLQVGEVASYALDSDGKMFTIRIFVRMPYDQYVNPNTRFWQASGVDVALTANGLKVQTESVLAILIGGIAFETPPNSQITSPAEPETVYTLYSTHADAYEPPPRNPQTYQLIFKDSVRGLSPGAPVEFRGIKIGEVADIRAQFNMKTMDFSVPVTIELDPQRLGVQMVSQGPPSELVAMRRRLIDSLVARGVRAQLRTGNLLTGAAYVALDFFPNAKPFTVNWSQNPAQLPTISGDIQRTEAKVEDIVDKLDKMPFTEIGDELRGALAQLNLTLASARGTLDNANSLVSPDSPQAQQLSNTMEEVSRAAQSLRVLADYLEQHPEVLLRGKQGEPK